jgi:NhaP-type Na+/H+ or K+/H+ antiporter
MSDLYALLPKIMPLVIITLSLLSAIIYLFNNHYTHALYWLLGASITATVTFGMKV